MENKEAYPFPNQEQITRKLVQDYPNLSLAEIRVCTYLRMNMTSNRIAKITERSVRTIEFTRNRIRKKMNLKPDENLTKHILSL